MSVKTEIQHYLKDIVSNILIRANDSNYSYEGIFGGDYGSVLLLFYYANYSRERECIIAAEAILQKLLDNLDSLQNNYCNGLSGVLYLFEFFKQEEFIEIDFSESQKIVENYLLKMLAESIDSGHNDFLHGSLGISFYFLKINDRQTTNRYIDFLYDTAQKDNVENTFNWSLGLEKYHNRASSDISLSHGMSGLLIFLTRAYQEGYQTLKTSEMIEKGLKFILNEEMNPLIYGSYFPCFALDKSEIRTKSRLAWCYGDLGIASALWYAGNVINNTTWRDKAIEIFQYSTKRRSLCDTDIVDAAICHGSAGIAMIFNRMYLNTNISEFNNAREYWIKETLKHIEEKTKPVPKHNYSLLTGFSGISLVLLSFLADDAQLWDELFLLSY
jgi:lantibiotic biosynthesis protein